MSTDPEELEIKFVTIAGRDIDVASVVCPACNCVDLDVDVDTSGEKWKLTDSLGHKWEIVPTDVHARTN